VSRSKGDFLYSPGKRLRHGLEVKAQTCREPSLREAPVPLPDMRLRTSQIISLKLEDLRDALTLPATLPRRKAKRWTALAPLEGRAQRRGRADQNTGFTWQGLYIVRGSAETDALDYVSCARL